MVGFTCVRPCHVLPVVIFRRDPPLPPTGKVSPITPTHLGVGFFVCAQDYSYFGSFAARRPVSSSSSPCLSHLLASSVASSPFPSRGDSTSIPGWGVGGEGKGVGGSCNSAGGGFQRALGGSFYDDACISLRALGAYQWAGRRTNYSSAKKMRRPGQ